VRCGGFNGDWFITPPQARHVAHDFELGSHKRERGEGCGFSEDVCKVVFTRDEVHDKSVGSNFIVDKMEVDFNVSGAGMECRIGR
jgi:hypothetical protein